MVLKKGVKVKVEYTGTLDDGTVFDTTSHEGHSHPIEFEIGAEQVLPKFEEAVKNMNVGDERTIKIPANEAYGELRKELIKSFPRNQLPPTIKEGMVIGLTLNNGAQIPARVIKVTDDEVTIDLNHPLAGKDLNFKLKLVEAK